MKTVLVLLLALGLLGLSGSPAAAADERLGLSRDGVVWEPSIEQPLFDPGFRWVPGDVMTESFFVRNQSTDGAELSVDLSGPSADDLIATGDLLVEARADGRPWGSIAESGQQRLVTPVPAAAGQVSRVDLRVSFDPASTNESQTLSSGLELRVVLQQVGNTAPSGSEVAGVQQSGLLPSTGGPVFWILFAGTALLVSGLVAALRRCQEQVDHHVR